MLKLLIIILITFYWFNNQLITQPIINNILPNVITNNNNGVVLTFNNLPTYQLLDTLNSYNTKVIFFIQLNHINNNHLLLIKSIKYGHELGILSNNTIYISDKLESELYQFDLIINQLYYQAGRKRYFKLLRSYYYVYNPMIDNLIKNSNYQIILGSIYTFDSVINIPMINYYYIKYHVTDNDIIIMSNNSNELLMFILPWLSVEYKITTIF